MADKPAFDPLQPFEAADKPAFDPSKPYDEVSASENGKKDAPKRDFSWSQAITDIPSEIGNAASEAASTIAKPFSGDPRDRGTLQGPIDTLKAVAAVPALIASPLTGAARSIGGHLLTNTAHAIVGAINPDNAAKIDPEKDYQDSKAGVDLAMSALGSKGPRPPAIAPAAAPNEVVGAAERLGASGNPVDVPQALASDSMITQRAGQAIRNVPVVGDAIPKATARLTGQLEDATSNVASEFGGGSGPNVAHNIGQNLSSAADAETSAARNLATNSDNAVLSDWERSIRGANDQIAATEGQALARARQTVGDMSPQDMGETLTARLRQGEQEARATKDRLYNIAGESDASVSADSVRGVHGRVSGALDDVGRVVDGELTPAASRMMTELRDFSNLRIPNRVGPAAPNPAEITAVDARGMEQIRKRLSGMSQAATNDADRAASRIIMRQFDEWQADAFDNALMSGSDEALQAFRSARAANAEWRQRYFNDRDDADRIVNRIVTGEVTPQEVSNYVLGATKVGSKGVSSRLLTRIGEATGGDPEAMGAIRAGIWNKLSSTTEGTTAKAPAKIASDINEFLGGSGRDVANRMFDPPQQAVMRAYAQELQRGAVARDIVSDVAANTKPSPMEVGTGPLQKLANDVLGKNGGRSDEALFSAINSYAKSGAKGDINLLSKIIKAIPEKDQGNLAGAIIKNMGVSPRTGQFSPDVFVSTWGTYKPEAKALLFGMTGPQRAALDDIATISRRMKEVGAKFGNPSGTAQNVNFFALASSAIAAPLWTLSGALGGAVVAKLLASPVGASSTSKWSRAYERLARLPSAATSESFKRATALLAVNIHGETGAPIKDLVRQLQGSVPATAEDKQQ